MKKLLTIITLLFAFIFNANAQIDKYTCKEQVCMTEWLGTHNNSADVKLSYGIVNGDIAFLTWFTILLDTRKHKTLTEKLENNAKYGMFNGKMCDKCGVMDIAFKLDNNTTLEFSVPYLIEDVYDLEANMDCKRIEFYISSILSEVFEKLEILFKHNVKSFIVKMDGKTISPVIKANMKIKNTIPAMAKDLTKKTSTVSSASSASKSNKNSKTTFSNTKKTFTVKGVNFTMIPVQGGTFTMGSKEFIDCPPHKVTLSSYMIGETEVTQALWKAVMGTNPTSKNNKIGNNYPVTDVSWDDCQVFIKNLNALTGQNFRLPTEAEWEFAARGGNKSRGYAYSGSNTPSKVAWYCDNSGFCMHAVKTKLPNELGIYDMSGNVTEWCKDYFDPIYNSEPQTNPQGPSSGGYRVLRDFCYSHDCEKVYRRSGSTNTASGTTVGLRLAL